MQMQTAHTTTVVYEEALEDAVLGEINSGANVVRYGIGHNMKISSDSAGHNNDMAKLIEATTRFDDAVTYAIEFVLCHPKTVLIVTADHETGGVTPDNSVTYGYKFTSTNHTGVEVPLFAIGAGASTLNGKVTDNTQISSFIAKAFEAKTSAQKLSPAA